MPAKANLSTIPAKFSMILGHVQPDFDWLLCYFILWTYVLQVKKAQVLLVPKGYKGDSTEDQLVFDVGGGRFDHHGKIGGRETCSAIMLAEALGLQNSPEMKPLLELALDVDQANKLPVTSIALQVNKLGRKYNHPAPGTPEWNEYIERVFEIFENIRSHEENRSRKRAQFADPRNSYRQQVGDLRVVILLNRTDLRDAAFESGADVIIWTNNKGEYPTAGVQVNRDSRDKVKLGMVADSLRRAEARARGIDVRGQNLTHNGKLPPDPAWYLDDGGHMILSRCEKGQPTPEDQSSILKPWDIVDAAVEGLKWKPRVEMKS
jgi:hypothetical protein